MLSGVNRRHVLFTVGKYHLCVKVLRILSFFFLSFSLLIVCVCACVRACYLKLFRVNCIQEYIQLLQLIYGLSVFRLQPVSNHFIHCGMCCENPNKRLIANARVYFLFYDVQF